MEKLSEWYYKHIDIILSVFAVLLFISLITYGSERLPEIYQAILRLSIIVVLLVAVFTYIISTIKAYKKYETRQFENRRGKAWWWVKHG